MAEECSFYFLFALSLTSCVYACTYHSIQQDLPAAAFPIGIVTYCEFTRTSFSYCICCQFNQTLTTAFLATMTALVNNLVKMSPIIIRATSSDARSSNPPDPPNQPVQNFDHQDLAQTKIDTQDTENLIAMASRVSLLPRASEHRLLPGRY